MLRPLDIITSAICAVAMVVSTTAGITAVSVGNSADIALASAEDSGAQEDADPSTEPSTEPGTDPSTEPSTPSVEPETPSGESEVLLKAPAAPKKLKATAGMKRIRVTWRKSSGKYVVGYELAYKKKGAKAWRYKTVKGRARKACTLKNLATKKYTLKIRTVAKLGKVTRKSKWSKTVKATPYVAYGYYKATQKWRVYNQKSVEHGSVGLPLTYGTVSGSGCGLCAVAIGCHLLDTSPAKVSFKRWKISNFVKKLRKYELKHEMVTTAGGSGWGSLKRFANWLTVNGRDVKVKNATRTSKGILKELKKKHVVVAVSRGYCFRTEEGVCYDPGCGHYICFYGYKNGVFYAKDSWGSQGGSACKYTATQLNRFLYDTRLKPAFTCFSMGVK